jgi:hypothetical protein
MVGRGEILSSTAVVYWPSQELKQTSGLLVGWNLHGFVVVVSCVVPMEDPVALDKALHVMAHSSRYAYLRDYAVGRAVLIGSLGLSGLEPLQKWRRTANVWLSLTTRLEGDNYPELVGIWSLGHRFVPNCRFIIYSRPQPSYFYSLHPMQLDMFEYRKRKRDEKSPQDAFFEKIIRQLNASSELHLFLSSLLVSFGSLPLPVQPATRALSFSKKLSWWLFRPSKSSRRHTQPANQLQQPQSPRKRVIPSLPRRFTSPLGTTTTTSSSCCCREDPVMVGEDTAAPLTNLQRMQLIAEDYSQPPHTPRRVEEPHSSPMLGGLLTMISPLLDILMFAHILLIIVVQGLFTILNLRLPLFSLKLKEVSATLSQLELRLQQLTRWPEHMLITHVRWKNQPETRANYLGVYNHVFLVLIDICLGSLLSLYLLFFTSESASALLESVLMQGFRYYEAQVEDGLVWLMGWPGGLRLNDFLNHFLGQFFLYILSSWHALLRNTSVLSPIVLVILSCSGFAGLTVFLAVLSDIILFLVAHISLCYYLSCFAYSSGLTVLSALWKLFRGIKLNPLRERVDTCHYEMDQLLLGTVIFAVVSFLIPTLLIFYTLFAALKLGTWVITTTLDFTRLFITHFPPVSLFLSLFDRNQMPGGVRVECSTKDPCYLILKPFALPRSAVFYHVNYLVGQYAQCYRPEIIANAFLYGNIIHKHPTLKFYHVYRSLRGLLDHWVFLKCVIDPRIPSKYKQYLSQ